MNKNLMCNQYLDILYKDSLGFQEKKKISETYGEILTPAINKIISKLDISNDDIFLDLGSGLGKIALQFFLCSEVQESYGIEISPTLYHQSILITQKFKQDLPEFYEDDRKLNFMCGDFLQLNLPQATIVLISSRCFSQRLLNAVAEKLETLENLRCLLTLRPFPHLKKLVFRKTLRIECSWDTALCYLYAI